VIPIRGSNYVLSPINCTLNNMRDDVIAALTDGRNENFKSFLTTFIATKERTRNWLVKDVAFDNSRIIFVIRELNSNKIYGYAGLAFGDKLQKNIEVDAVVRFGNQRIPGIMRIAVLELVQWALNHLNFTEVWVRVLSDNSAISFYENCGFVKQRESVLYESVNDADGLTNLTQDPKEQKSSLSTKKLVHMLYSIDNKSSGNMGLDSRGGQNR
jgi:RimJ/RimL family protein N-acetyltransferase